MTRRLGLGLVQMHALESVKEGVIAFEELRGSWSWAQLSAG